MINQLSAFGLQIMQSIIQQSQARTEDKTRETRTEAETVEEGYLPDCSESSLTPSANHLRSGTTHSRLDPPTSIINQETAPQTCGQAYLMAVIPPLRLLVPR